MRFYLKYLIALIGIVAVSCTQDNTTESSLGSGQSVAINFVLSTEDAQSNPTRAISDGTSVNQLYYAVYTESGEIVIPKAIKRNATGLASPSGLSMTISLPSGRNYKAVFWAQNSDTEAYTLTDEMVVSVNYALACNDEKRDAFYGVTELFATSDDKVEVTLHRPFAQLNAGAYPFDWEYIKGFHNFDITKSCVRIRDVAHTLNLLTGELSD